MTIWDILLLIWLGIVPALILAAMLVNLASANLVRQWHYYRDNPTGDFNLHRRNLLIRLHQARR